MHYLEELRAWSHAADWRTFLVTHPALWLSFMAAGLAGTLLLHLLAVVAWGSSWTAGPIGSFAYTLTFVPVLGGYVAGYVLYVPREREHFWAGWRDRSLRKMADSVLDLLVPALIATGALWGIAEIFDVFGL